ncbi:MAG: methyltransferase domain-containing protein [Gammaproteobacteria bacterium]|nr:methyltransferase domain-containing protein [Gammaproteobacteria bacterium]
MKNIRKKWNNRYNEIQVPNEVIQVLKLNQHLLSSHGKSLDLACGLGGNALRMAELGFVSHAWDISDSAVHKIQEFAHERHLNLSIRQSDISQVEEQQQMINEGFDVIIVSRFLLRDIIPIIKLALKQNGLIFYQTFVQEEDVGTTEMTATIPKNNNFRLEPNELLELFSGLRVRYYREEGLQGDIDKGFRNEAMLVAQKI